jgi:hypothetical protein
MRTRVDRNDPTLSIHLVEDYDVVCRLDNLMIWVVAEPECLKCPVPKATFSGVEIDVGIVRRSSIFPLVLMRLRPVGYATVRRIHDQ